MKNLKTTLVPVLILLGCLSGLKTGYSQSTTECPSLNLGEIINHPLVKRALKDAWNDSFIGPTHEEGGNIYQCYTENPDGSRTYDYLIRRSASGTVDGLSDPPPLNNPTCRLVAGFHTHPGPKSNEPNNDGYDNERPSHQDQNWGKDNGVPQIISFQGSFGVPRIDRLIPVDGSGSLEARNPAWVCPSNQNNTPSGSSQGDPHLKTIDGRSYDFQAAGEFVFCQSDQGELEIQVRQEPAPNNQKASFNTALAIKVKGEVLGFYTNPGSIWHNEQEITERVDGYSLPEGIFLKKNRNSSFILQSSNFKLQIYIAGSHIDFRFYPDESLKNQLQGLAGNFNGESKDDLILPKAEAPERIDVQYIHKQFGEYWRVSKENSFFRYQSGKTYGDYHILDYPKAYINPAHFSPEKYLKAEEACKAGGITQYPDLGDCIYDLVVTGNPELVKDYVNFKATNIEPQKANIYSGKKGFAFNSFIDAEKLKIGPWVAIKDGKLRLMDYFRVPKFSNASAYYEDPVFIEKGFELGFDFSITEIEKEGTDGFALVMTERYFLSDHGTLGYENMRNTIAIEFDTYKNENDPNDNHISIRASRSFIHPNDKNALATVTDIPNLSDGQIHKVKIIYQDSLLKIFMDDIVSPLISLPIDITTAIFVKNKGVLVGFKSNCDPELGSQVHNIHNWYYRGF